MQKLIKIRVIPKASRNAVCAFGDGYKVRITAPAENGRANRALIEVLAEHFGIKKSGIKIVSGKKSRNKTVAIEGKTRPS